jgi:hypothetical protein
MRRVGDRTRADNAYIKEFLDRFLNFIFFGKGVTIQTDIGVITEISSAHGDKNSALSNSNEVIHGPELISQHSKKVKNYTK